MSGSIPIAALAARPTKCQADKLELQLNALGILIHDRIRSIQIANLMSAVKIKAKGKRANLQHSSVV